MTTSPPLFKEPLVSANVDFVIRADGVNFRFARRISPIAFTTDFGKEWEKKLIAADLGPQITQLVRHFGDMATTVHIFRITPTTIDLKTWEGFDLGLAEQLIASTIGAGKFVEDRKSRKARIGR